jgi:ATP-dependent protease ClpP protease subunit
MKTWFSINASAAEVAEVTIFDEIGYWGVTAKDFLDGIKGVSAPTIRVSINSPGGSVSDALAIYNALRASGKRIEVQVLGVAASAASYIAMAGDQITMPENTFMFLHNPITGVYGNADDMRETADMLDKFAASLTATYMRRWKGESEALTKVLADETWLTAAECLENGLCDTVGPAAMATARFDVQNHKLPDNVRAALTPPPPAVAPAMAEKINAACTAAGFPTLVASLIADPKVDNDQAIVDAVANAREVKAVLAVLKLDDRLDAAVASRKSSADIRAEIAVERATEDERTPTRTTPPAATPVPQARKPLTRTEIYGAYNRQAEKTQ